MERTSDGTLIVYSTSPGETAADGNGLHSPFAEALLEYLPKPDLHLSELFNDVGLSVQIKTDKNGKKQTPWISSSPLPKIFLASTERKFSPIVVPEEPIEKIPTLKFDTEPSGAELYLDDVYIGKSPAVIELLPGRLNSAVNARKALYQSSDTIFLTQFYDSFNYKPRKQFDAYTYKLRPSILTIKSDPEKANIYLGNKYLGIAPVEIPYASLDFKSIVIAKSEGYRDLYIKESTMKKIEGVANNGKNYNLTMKLTPQKKLTDAQKYASEYLTFLFPGQTDRNGLTFSSSLGIKNSGDKDITVEFNTIYLKGKCGTNRSTWIEDDREEHSVDVQANRVHSYQNTKESGGKSVCYDIDYEYSFDNVEFDESFFGW